MNLFDCEFVKIRGTWLPGVADVKLRPVMIGDSERAVSGTLRTAFVGVAREWTVQLVGVPGDEVQDLFALLTDPSPAPVVVMGEEVTASVFLTAGAHVPVLRGRHQDAGRMNLEVSIKEAFVDYPLPGFTYEYAAFTEPGAFTWNWNDAGQPVEVDLLLVGGGGGGGEGQPPPGTDSNRPGGGGGAGGVIQELSHPTAGNISGNIGGGGSLGSQGGNTTAAGFTAVGGGAGNNGNGGSGGGSGGQTNAGTPGQGTPGQGSDGRRGRTHVDSAANSTYYAGGGGGASGVGAGETSTNGVDGLDLLANGWNYRLIDGIPRFIGGGGGAGRSRGNAGRGGLGGGGTGAGAADPAQSGQPNTGGGGGGGRTTGEGAPGGNGLVIIRWQVGS